MKLFIQSICQTICLSLLLFTTALVVQGKEKRETPTKRTEAASSKLIPALHIPRVHRVHPMLSKTTIPLSLDPIRFTLQANKQAITLGEEVEITITAQLLDIPPSAFFIFEEQKSFSIKLLLPQGFTQTGGDYREYIGAQLTRKNNSFTTHIKGVFTSLPEYPCFVLLRGAFDANASSIFEQKQLLCLSKKNTPKATREAECTPPALTPIAPQTICQSGDFYMVSTSVTNGVEVYYQWYNDNGLANANTNPIAGEQRANLRSFPTAPGVYQYKVVATSSANLGCSASQSVTLTINPLPTISSTTSTNPSCTPNAGGTISVVAAGGSALLYSKDNGGNWVNLTGSSAQDEITRNTLLYTTEKDVAKVKITLGNGFGIGPGGEYTGEISSQSAAPTFEGLAAGTYSIRVKNENGCISTPNEVTLTNPNAPAIFNVTGGGTCVAGGAPINLSGSSVGVNYSLLRNGVTVTAGVAGTGSALSFGNQTAEGTYTVMATNTTTNCSAQMNNNVVISTGTPPAAPVTIGGDKLFCAANATILEVSVAGGQTADWYAAATGGTPLNQGVGVTSFAPPTAGIYYVETRDITTQCKSSTRTAVTLLAAPTLSITGNTEIGCGNTSSLLSAYTNTGLPTGASVSYAWKNDPSGPVLATTDTLRVNSAGTYTLTLTYGSCALTASQTVSSTTATDPSATLSSSVRIACSGSLSIVPTLSNATASTVYEWSGPNGFTANTANIEVTQAGTYTLAVKKNATTPCSTQEIFVDEKPTIPQDPSLTATRLSIDPENSTSLLARGCSSLVSWSYISNDPPAESLNGFVAGSNTSTSVTLENTSPNLTLTYQDTPFQTSATYTAACVGECQNSTASIPITIFKNICGIKVQADQNAVVANTPVTLTAFFCETSNITWSTGQTGTRTITVTPTVTTTYFVVCNLPNQKACTDYVEIKTMPTICQNFTVNASAAEIEQGQQVTLMASGCTGQFTWKNDLGSLPTVTVYPNTTTTFTGICTIGTTSCEQTVNVKVKCDIVVKVTPIYDGSLWGIIAYKKVNVWASCNNSPLFINGERVEGGSYGSKLLDGTNDLTIVVSCGEGVESCSKTIQVQAVTRTCRDFAISATTNAGNLTLTASGCSEGNTVTWDNGMSGGTITIPLPIKPTMFKAICGRNGCENYYTYEKNYVNEYFTIRQKPGNGYPITLWPLNCTGTVSWESTPLTDFSVDINKNLTISQQPTQTTTYIATCKTDDNHIAQRSFTIQATANVNCILIKAPQSIEKGAVITLNSVGCLGTVAWKKSTNTTGVGFSGTDWLDSMTPLGVGQVITDQPLVKTIYVAYCDYACWQFHIVDIKPCNVIISSTKTTLKAGEVTTLTASGCPVGTINWINSTGELLGWGPQITLQLVKNTTVKAVCDVSKCENTLQITVPSGNPEEIICENLTLTANPNRPIYTGEPNTVTITATGCTGGTVTWNGPLLTTDTKTQYPSHQISIDNLQQAATYTAVCTKTTLPPTQATISIAAEIRFTLKAVPQAVEAGNTTLLTAEGCVGGAITWTSPVSACGSVPCSITSPAISAPATFTATCTINGQTLSKSVNVYLKSANGSIVYQSQCSNFNATYSLPSATLSPPYPKNTRIELYSSGCTGTVKWNAVDNQGNQRALTGTFSGLTDYPQLPTTYTATCEVNAQICATRSFNIPIHQSSCGENGFEVTWTEAKPGVTPSGAGQLSGEQTGSNAGKFFQESVQLGVSLVDQSGFSNYAFTISAAGCRSLDTDAPGIIEVLVNGVAPLSLQKIKAGDKIRISCKANPTTFPSEECYQILCIDGVTNNAYNPFFIRDCGKTTARQGVADGLAAIQQTTSTEQTTSSGCTAAYPLKDLMAGDYKALICNNINAFYDENGLFSVEKTNAFLLAIETYIKAQSVFSSYTLVFPTDYTTIANSIKDAAKNCANVEAIAKTITAAVVGTMSVDDYKSFSNAKFVPIENAARDALDTKYVFLTPDLKGFILNSVAGYSLVNCSTVSVVPAGTVPGFKVDGTNYCAVFDPATGLYSYRKEGILTAPTVPNLVLTGAFTAKTKVILVWGLGNCPVNGKKAIINAHLVDGKTKEQIAALIEAGLPNTEDIKCGTETIEKPRYPIIITDGSWLMQYKTLPKTIGSVYTNIGNGYNLKVYVTDAGISATDREQLVQQLNAFQPNDILLWIDYDTDGTAKYEYFMGSEAKKHWNNDSQNFFAQWLQRLRPVPSMVINPVVLLMNGIADLIGKLSIPPKYWDCARPDYVTLPFVTQGSDCPDNCITPEGWAFTAGIWDGIVNEVKGVPEGLGAIASDPIGVATALGNLVTFDGPTWAAIKNKIVTEHSEAASNPCLLNHLIATDIIATAAVVLPLTKLSKANIATTLTNLADNTLLTITKFKVAGQVAYKTAGGAINIVRNAGKLTFEVLSQGGRISRAYVNGAGKLYTTILIVNPDGIVAAIKEVKEILKNADGTPLLDVNGFQLARAELRNGNEVLVALDEFDDAITSKWATYLANNEWDVFRRKSTDVLRKSLAIPDGSGLHAHHKIPVEMLREYPYVQEAVNQGFEFSSSINGKALTGYEHLFTNATFYPHHNAYNNFVRQLIANKTLNKPIANAKNILEIDVIPEINSFLSGAESLGMTINDYAISKGFLNTR